MLSISEIKSESKAPIQEQREHIDIEDEMSANPKSLTMAIKSQDRHINFCGWAIMAKDEKAEAESRLSIAMGYVPIMKFLIEMVIAKDNIHSNLVKILSAPNSDLPIVNIPHETIRKEVKRYQSVEVWVQSLYFDSIIDSKELCRYIMFAWFNIHQQKNIMERNLSKSGAKTLHGPSLESILKLISIFTPLKSFVESQLGVESICENKTESMFVKDENAEILSVLVTIQHSEQIRCGLAMVEKNEEKEAGTRLSVARGYVSIMKHLIEMAHFEDNTHSKFLQELSRLANIKSDSSLPVEDILADTVTKEVKRYKFIQDWVENFNQDSVIDFEKLCSYVMLTWFNIHQQKNLMERNLSQSINKSLHQPSLVSIRQLISNFTPLKLLVQSK